jgi:DNA-directed RNA polymerase I subunit RPA1
VDVRHLNLIADIMTRGGGFTPFSRQGLKTSVSPFLKMSFETTCNFLKEAVGEGDYDDLSSPSSRIVVGKLSGVGSGSFDIMVGGLRG